MELLDLGSETELRAQKEALGREEAKASHGLRRHMVSNHFHTEDTEASSHDAKTRQGSAISHHL